MIGNIEFCSKPITRAHSQPRGFTMYKILAAAVLAALAAGPAAASEKTDVMAVLHQFIDAFNKGDTKSLLATCADLTSIIDDLPPHEWHGERACGKWSSDFDAFGKANDITPGVVTLGKPRHVDINAEHAYVVVPASYTFTMKGKPMKQSGSIITVALHKGASGWRMGAWAWGDGMQTEVKPGTGN
jgi:opacity protein-like surface antigen